LAEFAHFGK